MYYLYIPPFSVVHLNILSSPNGGLSRFVKKPKLCQKGCQIIIFTCYYINGNWLMFIKGILKVYTFIRRNN